MVAEKAAERLCWCSRIIRKKKKEERKKQEKEINPSLQNIVDKENLKKATTS